MRDSVTIIIAAYKRAETLNLTLESIHKQLHRNWKVLIIADCCDENFLDQINDSDPRVKVYNLSQRSGNQYGPNSIGIYLADTKYIAFLNHDDIWLCDHLTTAIESLEIQKADFFMGTAAFCHFQNQSKFIERKNRLLFSEKNKPYAIWGCIKSKNLYFEPCSTIVVETGLAKKAGYWKSPTQVQTSPLLDWLCRIMKCQPIICFSDKLTTLKFNLHHTRSYGGDYSKNNYLAYIPYYIAEKPGTTRKLIQEDIASAKDRGLFVRDDLCKETSVKNEAQNITDFINYLHGKPFTHLKKKGGNADFFLKVIESRTGEKQIGFRTAEEIVTEFIKMHNKI